MSKRYNLSDYSRETVERLAVHLLSAIHAMDAVNAGLTNRLNSATGDAHEIFQVWCLVQKEISEGSTAEISRILSGRDGAAVPN